jgi:hypothetical protein
MGPLIQFVDGLEKNIPMASWRHTYDFFESVDENVSISHCNVFCEFGLYVMGYIHCPCVHAVYSEQAIYHKRRQ